MKSIVFKVAVSSAVLGATTFGCTLGAPSAWTVSAASAQGRSNEQAVRLHREAGAALAQGNLARAMEAMEQAVVLSPRDVGYRLLLADIYMRAGRFQSAETTYGDVLALDPEQSRAGLTYGLMLAANGRGQRALAQLESIEGRAGAADLGLAFALAGQPQRAIEILEPAARAQGATARVRQNLALAYALGGDWARARTIAAQDVAPDALAERMTQWAALAQSGQPAQQVAAMIGASPVADPGQPVRLALNAPAVAPTVQMAEAQPVETPAPVQFAAAEPAAEIPMPLPTEEPAATVEPVVAPAPVVTQTTADEAFANLEQPEWGIADDGSVQLPEPAPAEQPVRVQLAAATQALVQPAAIDSAEPVRRAQTVRPVIRRGAADVIPAETRQAQGGRFVVQIGAFSTPANAERAWQQASERFGLSERQPLTMTFDHQGRLLHRVAVSGFDNRADAARLCESLRARGGECFVRTNAGDAAIRWAARYARRA
jgi:Flp pilus assembly protein TadD